LPLTPSPKAKVHDFADIHFRTDPQLDSVVAEERTAGACSRHSTGDTPTAAFVRGAAHWRSFADRVGLLHSGFGLDLVLDGPNGLGAEATKSMGLLIFTTLAALYFLPTLIGMSRRNVGAIFFLNLFLGWTVIGWVVCMVWALTKEEIVAPVVVHVTQAPFQLALPVVPR
jgi:hypothetical protein